jgi:hypothetical protein
MCRVDVAEPARAALARLLADMRDALCAADGADPSTVVIGPVDFGMAPMCPGRTVRATTRIGAHRRPLRATC